MKYSLLGWIGIFIFSVATQAQKAVSEVTLTYRISIESADNSPALSKSLEGATFTVFIKGNETKSNMQSQLGTESNLYDTRAEKGFILKEYSGQKLMITLTKENWAQKNQLFQNLKFTTGGEGQEISGYKTKKATATLDNGKSFIVYYSPEITTVNKDYNNAFRNLPGIPVQYELESGKLKFKYVLTGISYDNIPSTQFAIPKTGFRVMTYDENQQLKKGS